jgi:hypothetical protein
VKIDSRWTWLCDIEAESHSEAFRVAMTCLKPEHYDKPIRLEQLVVEKAEVGERTVRDNGVRPARKSS